MNLQVIGASFGRTGTLSLKYALQQLGYGPCLHMSDFAADSELCRAWLQELAVDAPDWSHLLAGYASTVDWPGCLFVEQFLRQTPTAKVIFTERDFDSWYKSISETVFPALRWARLMPEDKTPEFVRLATTVIGEGSFARRFDRESAQELYRRHRAQIIDLVPSGQLLFFDVCEGWGPICDFLERPVPAQDFPRENAAGEFFTMLSRMRGKRTLRGS